MQQCIVEFIWRDFGEYLILQVVVHTHRDNIYLSLCSAQFESYLNESANRNKIKHR